MNGAISGGTVLARTAAALASPIRGREVSPRRATV
jgi:hypothetical protein